MFVIRERKESGEIETISLPSDKSTAQDMLITMAMEHKNNGTAVLVCSDLFSLGNRLFYIDKANKKDHKLASRSRVN